MQPNGTPESFAQYDLQNEASIDGSNMYIDDATWKAMLEDENWWTADVTSSTPQLQNQQNFDTDMSEQTKIPKNPSTGLEHPAQPEMFPGRVSDSEEASLAMFFEQQEQNAASTGLVQHGYLMNEDLSPPNPCHPVLQHDIQYHTYQGSHESENRPGLDAIGPNDENINLNLLLNSESMEDMFDFSHSDMQVIDSEPFALSGSTSRSPGQPLLEIDQSKSPRNPTKTPWIARTNRPSM